MTEAQKKAARARFKRDGGIGKKKRGTATTKRKSTASKATGGGGGRLTKRTSFVTVVVGGAIGVAVASELGFEQAQFLQDKVIELATQLPFIETGIGVLAAALALKAAGTKKAQNAPIVGGLVAIIHQQWVGILDGFNMRP